jgi:nucleoside-diphosphate-sugar epimerase
MRGGRSTTSPRESLEFPLSGTTGRKAGRAISNSTTPGSLDRIAGSRVLVTGGTGLIGRAVVALLAEQGAHVTVYDLNVPDPTPGTMDDGAGARVAGSVLDVRAVNSVIEGHDAVVHLAGRAGPERGTPEEIYATNALGTFTVMEAAARAGVAKMVYASSINASGLPMNPHPVLPARYPWDEDDPADIADAYSLSKAANEAAARAAARRHGLALAGLRFPLVQDITFDGGTSFAGLVRRVVRENPRRQACEGWTYLDVRDAAAATLAALTHETPPAPGIFVAAARTYLRQNTDDALERFAPGVPRERVPGRDVPVNLHRARAHLGFKASIALEDLGPDLLADLDES